VPSRVAVLATLDTKGEEVSFLVAEITAAGAEARVVDVGLGETDVAAEVTADEVAASAGRSLADVRRLPRDEAMAAMGDGAGRRLVEWHARGELDGVIAVGGNQGTAIAAMAMRQLPFGPAKLIVSTVASGNVRAYVGDSDIAMQFSVADLLGGPNAVTVDVLRKAAAAIIAMSGVAMSGVAASPVEGGRDTVAVTAFGNTEPAVVVAMSELRAGGFEVIPFHASGACGSAMERLVDEGRIGAVLDLTVHELLGELHPQDIYTPVRAGRLTAAGRRGAPQVVVPGGLEYFCFGGPDTIPPAYRDRPTHIHNPYNTNVRTTHAELEQVAHLMADRLNAARGPVTVLVPSLGWSYVGSPGQVLHDPEANSALVKVLEERLEPHIPLRVVEATINDEEFARAAATTLTDLVRRAQSAPLGHHP
jgi:uncharacterized protein (UPF0261 family)